MTNKEAIMILESIQPSCGGKYSFSESEIYEAIDMAIEALNHSEIPNCSEPKCADGCIYGWGSSECGHCDYRSEEPKTGDTISRKAAIDVAIKADIENHGGVLSEKRARVIDKRISAMPPAQQEPKSPLYYGDGYSEGKMVYDSAECPNCGYIYDEGDHVWGEPYCPHCGQALDWYMRGEQDAEIR